MRDHILKFDDEAAARTALPDYCSQDQEGAWHWSGSVLGPRENFRGIAASAVWDRTDPAHPVLISPEAVLPGFYIGIATAVAAESDALKALPNDACRVILNRDASRPGAWVFLYVSSAVDPADLAPAQATVGVL